MNIDAWVRIILGLPPTARGRRYKVWRENKTIPEKWIQAIEKDFPPEEPLPPPLMQRAQNFAGAMTRSAVALLKGERVVVSPETRAKRATICHGNACGLYRASDDLCTACGCLLKAKAYLQMEACPKGFW